MQSDEQEIRKLVATWMEATKKGDTAAILELMSDDAVFLVTGQAPMLGRDAFAAASQAQAGHERPLIEGQSDIQEIVVEGDLAYMWAKLAIAITPPGHTVPNMREGYTLSILKKEAGSWRLARDANMLVAATPPTEPVAKAQMLIRRPVAEVFDAFIDPAITTKFWFTESSGNLEVGKTLRWTWAMYGASTELQVKAIEKNRRILIEWDDPPCPVEWTFAPRSKDSTLVSIANWGFRGNTNEVTAQVADATGGFSFVLAGLKAWLERGMALNLIADHHPDANL